MKYLLLIILSLIFFSSRIMGQSSVDLDNRISEQNAKLTIAVSTLKEIESKYPKFKIYGVIKERSKVSNYISVWGIATPVSGNNFVDGVLTQESNIMVYNPDRNKISLEYYSGGEHYFLEKDYGKNAFGADVPIYYYGDSYEQDKINSLKNDIASLENKLVQLKEQKEDIESQLKKQKELSELKDYVNEGDKQLSVGNYIEGINKYKSALELDNTNSDKYKAIIGKTYFLIGNKYFANNDYQNAVANYSDAYYYYQKNEYIEKEYDAYKIIGDYNLNNSQYNDAITYYEKALSTYPGKENKINPSLALAYFNLAKNHIANKENIVASDNLKKSYELDSGLRPDIEQIFSSLRKSPFLYATYSIIPGLGQIFQGNSDKGYTQLALFTGSIIASFVFNKVSKNSYNDYQQATTNDDAKNLYDQANTQKLLSNCFMVTTVGIIIWSIIDSFITVKDFNEPFQISYDYYSLTKSYNLSAKFNLR